MPANVGLILFLVVILVWIGAIVFKILLKKRDKKKNPEKYKVDDDED